MATAVMGWAWSTIILLGPDRITPAISHSDNQAAEIFFLAFRFLVAGHLEDDYILSANPSVVFFLASKNTSHQLTVNWQFFLSQ